MVYFAQLVESGSIKIGCSDNLEGRLQSLESYYGQPLALLATMPGDRSTERQIHNRFAHLRLGKTEQFRPAAELMQFIGKPLLVAANPETVEAVVPVHVRLRNAAIIIRSTEAWKAHVEKAAELDRAPSISDFIDRAVAHYARSRGFDPPPRR
jgi:hypothetical protein